MLVQISGHLLRPHPCGRNEIGDAVDPIECGVGGAISVYFPIYAQRSGEFASQLAGVVHCNVSAIMR